MTESDQDSPAKASVETRDRGDALAESVRAQFIAASRAPEIDASIQLLGNGSREVSQLSAPTSTLSMGDHRGVIDYQPDELILRARAGTPLVQLEALLAQNNQCFAAEVPQPSEHSSLGGAIACGWDGPARAFGWSLRDALLGCRIINGRGEVVNFGGQVMKNVAGYDLARLQVGAFGTLGAILDVTLRLQPKPEDSVSLCFSADRATLSEWWQRTRTLRPLLSGTCYLDGRLHLRLSGRATALNAVSAELGGIASDLDWAALKNRRLPFFRGERLACVYLPRLAQLWPESGDVLVEWEGARIWVRNGDHRTLAREAADRGGFVQVLRGPRVPPAVNAPAWHHAVRSALDPLGLFNRSLFASQFCAEGDQRECK